MSSTATTTKNRVLRDARLQWVPIAMMRINTMAQRELDPAWVNELAANFDLEDFGTPTVNARDGHFYIVDGHHRVRALEAIGYGDQQIQCWVYDGLDERQEAEKFLKLNKNRRVNAFETFKVSVTAEREVEEDINRIVRAQDLRISRDKSDGSIFAVTTLKKVYQRSDAKTLGRSLRLIRDAYGTPGFTAPVIDGIGLLCQRYNGQLEDGVAVERLSNVRAGVNGLLGKAHQYKLKTGNRMNLCVAAAAVDIYNAGRGGKKLPAWWKDAD